MRERRHTMIGAAGLALVAAIAAAAALWPARRDAALEAPARADASGPPRLAVTDIQLGRAVTLDKRVADPTDSFAADDTVYASVVTEGRAEHVRLTARFSRAGTVVAEVSQGIAPTGRAVSEFNIWKPGGLPPGEYEIEILVDGAAAGTRRFTVR
jgi:HAMP domain-containing protein